MRINVLTLFPEMFDALRHSIIGKAIDKNLIDINIINIRDYSIDKHFKCDDTPFGGGAGMVMTPQPIFDSIKAIDPNHESFRIYMSPKGKILNTELVNNLSNFNKDLIILCGHYEGIDQRVIDLCIDMEISIGDYVLTGGELPAMVLIDTISRFVPNVLGSDKSAVEESFHNNLLEYPQYTRPQIFENLAVPDVLISGHHSNIEKWRTEQSYIITKKNRPDLLEKK